MTPAGLRARVFLSRSTVARDESSEIAEQIAHIAEDQRDRVDRRSNSRRTFVVILLNPRRNI